MSCGGGLGFTVVVIIMIGRRELENAEQIVVAHTHIFGLAIHFDGPHSSVSHSVPRTLSNARPY